MARHDGLVHAVLRRQWGGSLPYEERLQAGRIGLWHALVGYDPKRGTAFSAYAWPAIEREVWRAVHQATPPHALPLPPLAPPADFRAEPTEPAESDEALLQAELVQTLHTLVNRLPTALRRVVVTYYGLDDEPARSLRQLAHELDVSHETVRLRLWAALVWLRHPGHSLTLRQLLERNTVADYQHADALAGRLPLHWTTPPGTPPSPKRRYRSRYQPPDPARVQQLDEAAWRSITLFDLLLLLVDFSGVRPVLASKLYRASARGREPFDPISFFLLFFWQSVNGWNRSATLRWLAAQRYADYREAFGFQSGVYPTESGYRHFLTALGRKDLDDLIRQSMELVHAADVIPTEALAHATVSFDGQIDEGRISEPALQPRTPDLALLF
ncbi:MAG: sigma-70 family RNA polymerase sigma factor [Actinobacteria bacterium]|nr:sigma-70 family RNA polymerase sigma factor [Actinomycetota bacterium]